MMDTFKNSLKYLMFASEIYGARMILAITEILWGISLVFSNSILNRNSHALMSEILPEPAWGIVFLLSGLVHFIHLLYLKNDNAVSIFSTFGSSFLWWFVVVSSFLLGYPLKTETMLAVVASWLFIRVGSINKQKNLK